VRGGCAVVCALVLLGACVCVRDCVVFARLWLASLRSFVCLLFLYVRLLLSLCDYVLFVCVYLCACVFVCCVRMYLSV